MHVCCLGLHVIECLMALNNYLLITLASSLCFSTNLTKSVHQKHDLANKSVHQKCLLASFFAIIMICSTGNFIEFVLGFFRD